MSRSNLLPDKPHAFYSRAEAVEVIDMFLAEQERVGRKGTRLVSISMDDFGRITSVQACDKPQKFRRLEKPQ